jgi:hypothetical protein
MSFFGVRKRVVFVFRNPYAVINKARFLWGASGKRVTDLGLRASRYHYLAR